MNFRKGIENENIGHQAEEETKEREEEKRVEKIERKERIRDIIVGVTTMAAFIAALRFGSREILGKYPPVEQVKQEAKVLDIKPPLMEEQSAPEKKIEDMNYDEFMATVLNKTEGINKLAELYVEVKGKYFYYPEGYHPEGGKELLSVTADNCVFDKILDKIEKNPSLAKEAAEALIKNGMDRNSNEVQIIESYIKE